MKKKMKYINIVLFVLLVMVAVFAMPSTKTYALNKLQIVYSENKYHVGTNKYTGDEKNPLIFNIDYDEIEIDYSSSNTMKFPFSFRVTKSSDHFIAKYMINADYEKKIVTFRKIGETSNLKEFAVQPPSKSMGSSYYQAGAVYDDNFRELTSTTAPTYKIEAVEKFSWGDGYWANTHIMGNGFIEGGTTAANVAAHPAVFIFCAGGEAENKTFYFSDWQVSNNSMISVMNYTIFNHGEHNNIVVKSHTTASGSGINLDFKNDKMSTITYQFYGLTSESLDSQQASGIERIASMVFRAVGDVFLNVLKNVCGADLNIDTLVFNKYRQTMVDFFNNASAGLYVSPIREVINGWYDAFSMWARIILMVILVAIGVMSILYAGTGNQKKISNMIVGWILAIALLAFGPYFMKYMIQLNDAIVQMLSTQTKYSIVSVYNLDIPEEYNFTFQLGEDSFSTLLEQLKELRGIVSTQREEAQKRKEEAAKKINEAIIALETGNLLIPGLSIAPNLPPGFDPSIFGSQEKKVYYVTTKNESKATLAHVLLSDGMNTSYTANLIKQGVQANTLKFYYSPTGAVGRTMQTNLLELETNEIINEYLNRLFAEVDAAIDDIKQADELLEKVDEAINIATNNLDLMGTMRERAGKTERLVYVIVWFILIFQLVTMLGLYYKRMLTIAVLIIIFPLIVMMYAIEKLMGIERPQTLKTWIQEYTVNVFIQTIHALVYLILVEAGLQLFEADADNWLLFVVAVFAFMPMEALIKHIIGMKASTVTDLAARGKNVLAGAAAVGAIAGVRGTYKSIDNKYAAKNAKLEEKNERKNNRAALANSAANRFTRWRGNKNGNAEGAQRTIDQRNQSFEANARARTAKLRKKQQANLTKAKWAKRLQVARNLYAVPDAVMGGLAMGGEAGDFAASAAISGMVAGSSRKFSAPKTESSTASSSSSSSASTSRPTSTQNSQNNSNGSGAAGTNNGGVNNGGTNINPTDNRAAENARNEVGSISGYGTGEQTQTRREHNREERQNARTNSGVQDGFRAAIRNVRPEFESKNQNIHINLDNINDNNNDNG